MYVSKCMYIAMIPLQISLIFAELFQFVQINVLTEAANFNECYSKGHEDTTYRHFDLYIHSYTYTHAYIFANVKQHVLLDKSVNYTVF